MLNVPRLIGREIMKNMTTIIGIEKLEITMDKLETIKVKCKLDSKNHLWIRLIRGLRNN